MQLQATFIIPTLNAEKFIQKCLNRILEQDLEKNAYEVLIVDGGSTDKTKAIVGAFKSKLQIRVLANPAVDAESGKRIGIKQAKGSIIILLDADNVIVGNAWLRSGVELFKKHPNIWGVESTWFVNTNDSFLNQYFTMLRITDPIARIFSPHSKDFIKKSYPTYDLIHLPTNATPIIGANGFFYKKSLVENEITQTNKFEEVNYVAKLISDGNTDYAVLKDCGIHHDYCHSIVSYAKKRIKIANKFLKRKTINQQTWADKVGFKKFLVSIVYNASIVGPLFEAIYQIAKTKNIAWLYHPIISFLTVSVYGYFFVSNKLGGALHHKEAVVK